MIPMPHWLRVKCHVVGGHMQLDHIGLQAIARCRASIEPPHDTSSLVGGGSQI